MRFQRSTAALLAVVALLLLAASSALGGRGGARRSRAVVVRSARATPWSPALSNDGPLGAYGPLGRLGAIGKSSWHPSSWMRAVGEWSRASRSMARAGGPLSKRGPLGAGGPLGRTRHLVPDGLQHGGPLAVLGPDGPLGARGPLGPLGPVGAHGFAMDAEGRYHQGGRIRRTIRVPYGSSTRTYELFEVYPADHAAGMHDNDTSFMAVGSLGGAAGGGRTSYGFPFHARGDQNVQIVVTPEARLDQFQIELLDHRGRVIHTSDSRDRVNFIELEVAAGTRLQARVTLLSSGHFLREHPFRLSVVGTSGAEDVPTPGGS